MDEKEREKFMKAYQTMPLGLRGDFKQREEQINWPTDRWGETLSINVGFETDPEAMKPFLPDGVVLDKPEVWYFQNTYRNVSFLAGRGYNFFGVRFFARYPEKDMDATMYIVCLMDDGFAVMTGREGGGFPKLLADVHEPIRTKTGYRSEVFSYGHKLLEVEIKNLTKATEEQRKAYADSLVSWRTFLHKYYPSITKPGVAAINVLSTCYATTIVDELYYGEGSSKLFDTEWKDTPALYGVVQGLQKLPVKKYLQAFVYKGAIIGETKGEILWDKSGMEV